MCLVLLVFSCSERYGGIMYDDRAEKGRSYLWSKILEQSQWGPRGREVAIDLSGSEIRNSYREGEELENATQEQRSLIDYVNTKTREIHRLPPTNPRHYFFKILVFTAINYSLNPYTVENSGVKEKDEKKKNKKRKTRKRKRKSRKKKAGCFPNCLKKLHGFNLIRLI